MSPPETAHRVRPLLTRLLGGDPGRMVHQPYGHGNVVFALPDRGLVVKTSPSPTAFAHTVRNLDILRVLGVPGPEFVARGDDGTCGAIVFRWIPGEDLGFALPRMTTLQKRSVAQSVVEIQARVGALPKGEGYGWTPLGVPGSFPSWTAVVEREVARLPEPYRSRLDLRLWRRPLRDVPPTVFLDDLTVKNVIVQDGRLRGVVDLDHVCLGDPLFALALAETTAILDCDDADYSRLLRDAWAPTARAERLADLYGAIFAASFLHRPNPRMALLFERRLERLRSRSF